MLSHLPMRLMKGLAMLVFLDGAWAGNSETVVLANCMKDGVALSQMAYFPGAATEKPASFAIVATNPGMTVYWEGAPVTATFADGNFFTASIPRSVGNGDHAGTGQSKFAQFECWKNWRENSYKTDDGTLCSQVYTCDHRGAGDSSEIGVQIGGSQVTFLGKMDVVTLFGGVWDRRVIDHCIETPVPLGACSITFKCSAPPSSNWAVTNGLSNFLIHRVAELPGFLTNVPHCACKTRIEHGFCIEYHDCTKVPSTATITIWNHYLDHSKDSEGGHLTYEIQCPSPQKFECSLCRGMAAAVGAIALTGPELAWAAGGGSATINGACTAFGC